MRAGNPPNRPCAARGSAATPAPPKSELTVLCERFQQLFGYLNPDGSPNMLLLNDVAEGLVRAGGGGQGGAGHRVSRAAG